MGYSVMRLPVASWTAALPACCQNRIMNYRPATNNRKPTTVNSRAQHAHACTQALNLAERVWGILTVHCMGLGHTDSR